jgi:hypothetical protein
MARLCEERHPRLTAAQTPEDNRTAGSLSVRNRGASARAEQIHTTPRQFKRLQVNLTPRFIRSSFMPVN